MCDGRAVEAAFREGMNCGTCATKDELIEDLHWLKSRAKQVAERPLEPDSGHVCAAADETARLRDAWEDGLASGHLCCLWRRGGCRGHEVYTFEEFYDSATEAPKQ